MYRLTNSIPYLLNRLGVRLGMLFAKRLESFGVTLQMYRVMACIHETPSLRLGDLAETLSSEVSTMSRLVGTMVNMKLVTRKRLPNNERAVSINLTKSGKALVETLIPESQHYEQIAISGLSNLEVQTLKKFIDTIYNSSGILESELIENSSAE